MSIEVTLKQSEYAMAVYLSAMRQMVNERSGVEDKKMGARDGLEISVDGLVAELAFCKYFNVFPDLSFDPRSGGEDCLMDGRLVDVKSTTPGKTRVYLPQRKNQNNVERYVWCWVDFRTTWILGWFAPEDIFVGEKLSQSPRADELHYEIDLTTIRKFDARHQHVQG